MIADQIISLPFFLRQSGWAFLSDPPLIDQYPLECSSYIMRSSRAPSPRHAALRGPTFTKPDASDIAGGPSVASPTGAAPETGRAPYLPSRGSSPPSRGSGPPYLSCWHIIQGSPAGRTSARNSSLVDLPLQCWWARVLRFVILRRRPTIDRSPAAAFQTMAAVEGLSIRAGRSGDP